MVVGLSVGLAASPDAAPASDDFWECATEHSDLIGVCCIFYGGDYDERNGDAG